MMKLFYIRETLHRDLPGGARKLPEHNDDHREGEQEQELRSVPDQQQGLLRRGTKGRALQ